MMQRVKEGMYDPKGNGKDKSVDLVQFLEAEPPSHLQGIVHRFLELKTDGVLKDDYRFHALPDACTYVVFDQLDSSVAGVSKLRAESEEFNLGKKFHFVNIRFLPGVWQGDLQKVAYGMVDTLYTGDLGLLKLNWNLHNKGFEQQQTELIELVENLMERKLVATNPVTEQIFQNLDDIQTVADMAAFCKLSARQLQRVLKKTTGFTPQ